MPRPNNDTTAATRPRKGIEEDGRGDATLDPAERLPRRRRARRPCPRPLSPSRGLPRVGVAGVDLAAWRGRCRRGGTSHPGSRSRARLGWPPSDWRGSLRPAFRLGGECSGAASPCKRRTAPYQLRGVHGCRLCDTREPAAPVTFFRSHLRAPGGESDPCPLGCSRPGDRPDVANYDGRSLRCPGTSGRNGRRDRRASPPDGDRVAVG